MAETRGHLHVQAQSAPSLPNSATVAANQNQTSHPATGTITSPRPKLHSMSAPQLAPQLSPTPGRTGRRLHTKVLEELRNVTLRKSPAINAAAVNASAAANQTPVLSPLNLNGDDGFESGTADGSSPRIPAPPNGSTGKAKNCGLCERSFTVFRAKHTCKVCLMKVCDDCSKSRAKLNRRLERRKGSRLCDACARDYSQLATPMLSPSDARHENRRSSVESDTSFELGGRHPEKSAATPPIPTNPASERLQRAASIVKQTILSSGDFESASGSSFLRPRHWFSLGGVAFLLMARWCRFQTVSSHGGFVVRYDEDQAQELLIEAHGIALLFLSLTNWIDRLASLRVLGSYLLGLVAYDEFTARSERHAPRHVSAVPPQSAMAARKRLRSRARSNMSESVGGTSAQPIPQQSVCKRDDDEVLEVEVGDKPLDDGEGFNYDKLVAGLVDCATKNRASDGTMKMSAFLVACDFLCGLTSAFGRATSFAGSTVSGYLNTITTNLAAWPVPDSAADSATFSWREESVRAVVLREVEMKTASSGGKKKPSCSRCVLRLIWFVEFVEAVVRYTLIENKDESCAAGASKAYEETIGSRHPWIIRKGVNSAMSSLPTRSAILESLHLNELTPEEIIERLRQAQSAMRTMLNELNTLFKEHNLLDIK